MESVHEEWRQVPGFEGKYEVSSKGRVKSCDRIVERTCRWGVRPFRWTGRILSLSVRHGYAVTKLGGDKRQFGVHRLVAWAFIGPQVGGLVVNHIDGNKQNNTPSNLEYVTNTENVKHAYRTGLLDNRGEKNGNHRTKRIRIV